MWKKVAIAGAVAAGILGAGTAAMAATGSSSSSAAPQAKQHPVVRPMLRNFQHGQWVTRRNGQDVSHAAIRGTVTAVSSTSITVQAADTTSWTYAVTGQTKVAERTNGKGSGKAGTVSDVRTGDRVMVTGTQTGPTRTAAHILDTGSH